MKSRVNASVVQGNLRWNVGRLRRITTASHRYIAEVDGLRFIAIFSVMLFHVYFAATHVPGVVLAASPFDFVIGPVIQGFRGVQLFFVISGFILGLPFAAHYLANGPAVKIGRFYVRRLTRLEPPYILALLLFYVAAIVMHNVHTREPGFLSGLVLRLGYAFCFVRGAYPLLDGVTWTLEIEVQFYLLAPLLAHVFKLATWPRRLTLIAVICGAPLVARIVPRGELTLLGFAQYFLAGFLLADIHCTGAGLGRLPARVFDLLGIGCLVAMTLAPETPVFRALLPWLLCGMFVSALRGGWFTAFLRRPLISVLGGMCYSLYLLHYPLLSFVATKIIVNGQSLPQAYLRLGVVGMPIVVAAGIAYYILIERPCMNPNWPRLAFQRATRLIGAASRTVRPLAKSGGD
jgi:peptidoglycan/LPS O-acetylase OafA/YrhL